MGEKGSIRSVQLRGKIWLIVLMLVFWGFLSVSVFPRRARELSSPLSLSHIPLLSGVHIHPKEKVG